jgi:hypothetical protein
MWGCHSGVPEDLVLIVLACSNEDQKLDSLRPGSREMESGR